MLYVTTRSNRDAFTAQRALMETRGSDGGLYVPFRLPVFSREEIEALADKSFSKCVADVLNMLFNTRLSSWDVEFCVGRYPVRLAKMSRRILIGECWHNPDWTFSGMAQGLSDMIRVNKNATVRPGDWAETGIRIAVLFGIFGELIREGITSMERRIDLAMVAGSFSAPMSAWYARAMGLPVGNIILCCNENNTLWDLFHQGQLRTDTVAISTAVPDADVTLPSGLERLIHACGGPDEVDRYLSVCRQGKTYYPADSMLVNLRKGMHVSVISQRRMSETIPNVFGTNSYLLSPYGAIAYAGLQDYRSRTGESRCGLVLSDKSPVKDIDTVVKAMNKSKEEIQRYIDAM